MKSIRLAAVMAAAMLAGTAQAADTFVLKFGHFLPATSHHQRLIFEPWCEKLKSESAGRLSCQLYPSMQLGGTPAKLADMVRNGVADIVCTAPSYSPGKFPRIEAMEQPFMLPYGARKSNPMVWKFYEDYARDEFTDYKVLAMHSDGGMGIHTARKPVKVLADLKDMKLRASNRSSAKLIEALGATPVSMPPAQMTESISKGVIDGVLFTWNAMRDVKVNEVTHFHTEPSANQPALSSTVLTMLMNKNTFNRLPDDLKAIIERNSGPALNEFIGEVWDGEMDAAFKQTPASEIVQMSDADYQAMQTAAAQVADNWVKEVDGKGLDGEALLKGARAISQIQ